MLSREAILSPVISKAPKFEPTIDKRNPKTRTGALIFWTVLGFIAAQRFSIPEITGYLCLLPWLAALFWARKNIPQRNSFLILALFWLIDNAVLNFGQTIGPIRYVIYITAVWSMIENTSVNRRGLAGLILAIVFYTVTTVISIDAPRSILQFIRDLQILVLLGILFALNSKIAYSLDLKLLFYSISGYLASELVNFFFFSNAWYGEYMNFSGTKYLIVLPAIIALFQKRPFISLLLAVATVPVLIGYTQRFLFFAYLAAIPASVLWFRMKYKKQKQILLVLGVIFLGAALTFVDRSGAWGATKPLAAVEILAQNGLGAFETLDPVRFYSSALYFQLSAFELLFGRGLGGGLVDSYGILSFVKYDQSAFSQEEVATGVLFNLHDIWVDVGLRFGLLPFLAFLIWFIRFRPKTDANGNAVWILAAIGIVSAFYALSGLITIFMLLRSLQDKQRDDGR